MLCQAHPAFLPHSLPRRSDLPNAQASPQVRVDRCVKQVTKGLIRLALPDLLEGFGYGMQDHIMPEKRFRDTIAFSMNLPRQRAFSDRPSCIAALSQPLHSGPYYNTSMPRGHRWFIHQYLTRESVVLYADAGNGAGVNSFISHYDATLVLFAGDAHLAKKYARYGGRVLIRPYTLVPGPATAPGERDIAVEIRVIHAGVQGKGRLSLLVMEAGPGVAKKLKRLAEGGLLRHFDHIQIEPTEDSMTLEEYCGVRELLFQSHYLWSHYPRQKDVWRRKGMDEKVYPERERERRGEHRHSPFILPRGLATWTCSHHRIRLCRGRVLF